jgi:hypothetical protein
VKAFGETFRTMAELLRFFGRGSRWWLFPMIVLMLLFGILLMLATATPFGPFIYTLF